MYHVARGKVPHVRLLAILIESSSALSGPLTKSELLLQEKKMERKGRMLAFPEYLVTSTFSWWSLKCEASLRDSFLTVRPGPHLLQDHLDHSSPSAGEASAQLMCFKGFLFV